MGPVDFVRGMEEALIRVCGGFQIKAGRVPGLTGVWCGIAGAGPERKIGAIGIHVSKGITSHGFAFNVTTDLSDFELIIPCGIPGVPGLTGVWCGIAGTGPERKIGAIGIHVAKGITSHGFAFNVTTDLGDFELIIPCGIPDHPVTNLERELAHEGANALPEALPALETVAHQAAKQFGLVFSEPVLAVESLDALRQSAGPPREFPAEDTPAHAPAEVERLRGAAGRPLQA